LAKTLSHPSSLTRAVSSETLSSRRSLDSADLPEVVDGVRRVARAPAHSEHEDRAAALSKAGEHRDHPVDGGDVEALQDLLCLRDVVRGCGTWAPLRAMVCGYSLGSAKRPFNCSKYALVSLSPWCGTDLIEALGDLVSHQLPIGEQPAEEGRPGRRADRPGISDSAERRNKLTP
jgi:hypothetical protein